uniref:Uncharacterized protein n=1 Tax=Solanum lycopersicum TaxID=4081 RepID=A0A3Q7HQS2_SOLLC
MLNLWDFQKFLCLWTVKCCLDNLTTVLNIKHKLHLQPPCLSSLLLLFDK